MAFSARLRAHAFALSCGWLAGATAVVHAVEAVVGTPCEGCEAVFEGLPAVLASASRIAPEDAPGEPLQLSGLVRDAGGQPAVGIVIYAYQTDHGGIYLRDPQLSGAAARHGRLRGWVRTDAQGRYTFRTIRPGAYPDSQIPQHIHLHLIEPGRCTYYIGDVLFSDDPHLSERQRGAENSARGGSGVVTPTGSAKSGWRAQRDITLGLNVPGYADCGA